MLISIGKCYKTYFFILGSALFKLLSLVLIGNSNKGENGFGLFGFCPTFNKFNFTQSIFIYFGYIIFGIIFYFFKKIKKADQGSTIIKIVSTAGTFIYNIQIKFV